MRDPLIEALDRLVWAGIGITSRALVEAGAAPDLTLQQWRALVVAAEADGTGVRVGDLGRRLGMAAPGASRLARRLEARGLVVVVRDAPDRRAALVRPTDAGRALWSAVAGRRRALIAEALDAEGRAPAEEVAASIAGVAEVLARNA